MELGHSSADQSSGYHPIGLVIPLRRCCRPWGLPTLDLESSVILEASPATRELTFSFKEHSSQPRHIRAGPSREVSSPSALQSERHGYLELASLDTFHLQGFSPSWRFTSFPTLWPYFMPVTPVGFPLQGLSPSQSFLNLSI